jgi:hypothetical protein
MKRISWKRPETADLVLTIGSVSLVLVCLFLLGAPALRHLQGKAKTAEVRGNAATLQLAAETYAFSHLGRYPEDPLDLLSYLPGDVAPNNPFTGEALRFRSESGDLTYRSPSRGGDYIIEAWGPGTAGVATRLLTLQGTR